MSTTSAAINKREAIELLISIKKHFESQTRERTMPSGDTYVPKPSQVEYNQRMADQLGQVLDFMFS